MEKHQALEGIRVVDFSWYAVGPQTARHLSNNGAEVIRIESSESYDGLRITGPFRNDVFGIDNSGYYANQNSNKYGMTLNLKLPKAIDIVKRLISIC